MFAKPEATTVNAPRQNSLTTIATHFSTTRKASPMKTFQKYTLVLLSAALLVAIMLGSTTQTVYAQQSSTKWNCHLRIKDTETNEWVYSDWTGSVEITWGHTTGDATWACNNWISTCGNHQGGCYAVQESWNCYLPNTELVGDVKITWGHTTGDATWACNSWISICGNGGGCNAIRETDPGVRSRQDGCSSPDDPTSNAYKEIFEDACNKHDICWNTNWESLGIKLDDAFHACNSKFAKDMFVKCDALYWWTDPRQGYCHTVASWWFVIVDGPIGWAGADGKGGFTNLQKWAHDHTPGNISASSMNVEPNFTASTESAPVLTENNKIFLPLVANDTFASTSIINGEANDTSVLETINVDVIDTTSVNNEITVVATTSSATVSSENHKIFLPLVANASSS